MSNRKKRPRIDWGRVQGTTGTARMLMDSIELPRQAERPGQLARPFVEARLVKGDQIQIEGLVVRIEGVSHNGREVNIKGTVLR